MSYYLTQRSYDILHDAICKGRWGSAGALASSYYRIIKMRQVLSYIHIIFRVHKSNSSMAVMAAPASELPRLGGHGWQ